MGEKTVIEIDGEKYEISALNQYPNGEISLLAKKIQRKTELEKYLDSYRGWYDASERNAAELGVRFAADRLFGLGEIAAATSVLRLVDK